MTIKMANFQQRCRAWVTQVLGEDAVHNTRERGCRFLEEALELGQSVGLTKEDATMLVEYVFNRPVGEPAQEVGGTMTTLASLCNAIDLDVDLAGELELQRCWDISDKIRAKALAKRTNSALPGVAT